MARIFSNKKKGSIFDVLGWIIIIPVFIIIAIAIYMAYANFDAGMTEYLSIADDPVMETQYNETINKQVKAYPSWMDVSIALITFGLFIIILITSYLLGNNPIYLIIFVLMSISLIITGIAMEAFLGDLANNSEMVGYFVSFPITLWIIDNFLYLVIFLIGTSSLALYMKIGGQGFNG